MEYYLNSRLYCLKDWHKAVTCWKIVIIQHECILFYRVWEGERQRDLREDLNSSEKRQCSLVVYCLSVKHCKDNANFCQKSLGQSFEIFSNIFSNPYNIRKYVKNDIIKELNLPCPKSFHNRLWRVYKNIFFNYKQKPLKRNEETKTDHYSLL